MKFLNLFFRSFQISQESIKLKFKTTVMQTKLFSFKVLVVSLLLSPVIIDIASGQEITIFGGPGISNMSDKDNEVNYAKENGYKVRLGYNAGALVGIDIADNFQLQTGLMFSSKGFRITEVEKGSGFYERESFITRITYMEIPVLAKFNFNLQSDAKIFVSAGPTLGIALGGQLIDKYRYREDGMRGRSKDMVRIEWGDSDISFLKRVDMGLMLSTGIQLKDFQLGVFYNQGLINISDYGNEDAVTRNRMFGLSVAYVISINK
jgi:hypothetical protein